MCCDQRATFISLLVYRHTLGWYIEISHLCAYMVMNSIFEKYIRSGPQILVCLITRNRLWVVFPKFTIYDKEGLAHWYRDKMAVKIHSSLFLRFKLTKARISSNSGMVPKRLKTIPNQCWSCLLTCICVTQPRQFKAVGRCWVECVILYLALFTMR